jgi:hypothetical protein
MVIPLDNSKGEVFVQAIKAYEDGGGCGYIAPPILNFAVRWWWVVRFTPGDMVPSTNWIGGWVGTRAIVDTAEIFPVPAADQTTILQLPAHSLFTTYTTYAVLFPWTTNTFFSFCLAVAVSSLSCSTATVELSVCYLMKRETDHLPFTKPYWQVKCACYFWYIIVIQQ